MRSGWNPTRRNKNIGTKAQGHNSNNKMVIPESWHSWQRYWENLTSYVLVKRMIGHKKQLFFVEPTRLGWFYSCTIDDIVAVLKHCKVDDINSFDFIVLRQPTRKQRIISPVWGRAQYAINIDGLRGSAIIIEAQSLEDFSWNKSLAPEKLKELERLKKDGHSITTTRRNIIISSSITSIRNTVLFRTLWHEIGHHIDYCRTGDDKWDEKTHMEKENYADRYADEQYQLLSLKHIIPFEPIIDKTSLKDDALKLEWFVPIVL